MMKFKFPLLLKLTFAFALATQNIATACSCGPYEHVFCNNVSEGHNLIRCVVKGHPELHLMEVHLLENLHKEIEEDTIIILGQDGINCGESLDQFDIHDTLILAVIKGAIDDTTHWYLEGACGLHFLRYENGMVYGRIMLSVDAIADDEGEILITPNPVSENFEILSILNPIAGYAIFNANGQLITSMNLNSPVQKLEVASSHLHYGIYFIRIYTSKGILTRKFIR